MTTQFCITPSKHMDLPNPASRHAQNLLHSTTVLSTSPNKLLPLNSRPH